MTNIAHSLRFVIGSVGRPSRATFTLASAIALAGCLGSGDEISTDEDLSNANAQAIVAGWSGQIVRLRAAHSNKCVDLEGDVATDGAKFHQWSCHDGDNQKFTLTSAGNNQWELKVLSSGKAMDNASGANQGAVHQWTPHGGANQRWILDPAAGGTVTLKLASNTGLCLDVSGGPGATGDGPALITWPCTGGSNQRFTLENVIPGGRYNFGTLASPGKCLDVAAGNAADGANIQSWECNGLLPQSFKAETTNGNEVRLVNTQTGKCVDVAANGSADGTNIHQWTCNGSLAQSFIAQDAGGGNVTFVHAGSGKCIDVKGGGTANGTNVQLWTCSGSNAQKWRPALLPRQATNPPPVNPPPVNPPPSGGWSSVAPRGDGKWVRVRNKCPFPLWIHGAGSSGTLQPDDQQLGVGASRDYVAPNEWSAARVTAYTDGPRQGELEKAEITITNGVLNFNVTYVDWVGLPLEIVGIGGNCNASHVTGCYARQADVNNGCPAGFLREGKKCLSARTYCLNPVNQGSAYCHALDSAIANCPSCPKASTPEVYACSGAYANEPRWCAALNRAMTGQPDNANAALFYQNPPYNTYAKWVHQVCPDIYAFSYDDWLSHGGFRACSGDEIRITFCPGG